MPVGTRRKCSICCRTTVAAFISARQCAPLIGEARHAEIASRPLSSRGGPRVRRLAAGGRWIRTIGSWRERADVGGERDLPVIETEASHKKLFLLRGTDISNPSSSSSESAAKRTVAAPRAGRRRAPITGEGTESKKAIRRASVARPVASHTTGTARRTRAKVTDFYFGTKM
jgi:hypothetical protein